MTMTPTLFFGHCRQSFGHTSPKLGRGRASPRTTSWSWQHRQLRSTLRIMNWHLWLRAIRQISFVGFQWDSHCPRAKHPSLVMVSHIFLRNKHQKLNCNLLSVKYNVPLIPSIVGKWGVFEARGALCPWLIWVTAFISGSCQVCNAFAGNCSFA